MLREGIGYRSVHKACRPSTKLTNRPDSVFSSDTTPVRATDKCYVGSEIRYWQRLYTTVSTKRISLVQIYPADWWREGKYQSLQGIQLSVGIG